MMGRRAPTAFACWFGRPRSYRGSPISWFACGVAPARWDTGAEGPPPPDSAQPVRGDPELYHAQLWLMARGAYRIVVTVDGAHGPGSTIVPVMATAEQRFAVPYGLSGLLISAT